MKNLFYFLAAIYFCVTGYHALLYIYKFHSPYEDTKIARDRTHKLIAKRAQLRARKNQPTQLSKLVGSPQPPI
jgi:hypothetical protein